MLDKYQIDLKDQGVAILRKYKIVYYSLEMRTGKTRISLHTANEIIQAPRVLFVTKKKAISSVINDYQDEGFTYKFEVINYESIDKINISDYNVIIIDEAHSIGAYPKPSERTKKIRAGITGQYIIYLSGTPTPESYSQLFHQFWITEHSPWASYPKFYKWAKDYVNITQQRVAGGRFVNNYDDANIDKIDSDTKHLFVDYTQQEAGFKGEVYDHIVNIIAPDNIHILMQQLLKKRIAILSKDGQKHKIVADTVLKLKQKLHQIVSGTIKVTGNDPKNERVLLSNYKAEYIDKHFKDKKKAIFYKYIAERELLTEYFGATNCTDDPDIFAKSENTDLVFLGQLQSASEGTDLSSADVLIFYNIDYSFKTYWQARARMQNRRRKGDSHCYYLCSDTKLERKVYDTVIDKKSFTTYYFKKYFQKK